MQKNRIGKCKSERGTHDNCGKKWESTMQVEKRQKLQMEEKIEREYMEGTDASWKEATRYVENIDR